jgi:protein phosphatase
VGLLVVLAAVGVGIWIWALGHWFVGVQSTPGGERVAVFRGLPASVVGVDLYRVDHPTDLAVADLTPAARSRVQKGITADGSGDAARILSALRDQRLPVCGAMSSGGSSSDGAGVTAAPAGSSAPTVAPPPPGSAPTTPPPAAVPSTPVTTAPASSPTPGVDCREAK